MYFPYLYARTYEKSAILNTIATYSGNLIIPILNPFHKSEKERYSNSNLYLLCNKLVELHKTFIVVVDKDHSLSEIKGRIGADFDQYCIYGLLASQQSETPDLSNKKIAIIHDQINGAISDNGNILFHVFLSKVSEIRNYVTRFPSAKRVRVEDAFESKGRNKDYPVESIFSDLYLNYRNLGFIGFGDYLTLSEDFEVPTGANQNNITAALHLTICKNYMLYVRHFITTPNEEPDNSLRIKLVIDKALACKNEFLYTKGINLLEQKVSGTNLGMLKRISLEHHIELMRSLIL